MKIPLSVAGIKQMRKQIMDVRKSIEKNSDDFLSRMAESGVRKAQENFDAAEYDGEKDAQVSMERRGHNRVAVVAKGESVLFLEFGAGVYQPDGHPDKPQGVLGRGEYGKGRGKRRAWGFYKEDGSLQKTHGNPSYMCMYLSERDVESEAGRIAREVLK